VKHIRVFAQLGFWKPCILAKNLSASETQTYVAIEAQLAMFFPIINNVISIEVTDVHVATPVTTIADVHTATPPVV